MRAPRPFFRLLSIVAAFGLVSPSLPLLQASEPAPSLATTYHSEPEAPFNKIHTAVLSRGRRVGSSVQELPPSAFSPASLAQEASTSAPAPPHPSTGDKIHPALRAQLTTPELDAAVARHDARQRFIITFRDVVRLPRFPAPALHEPPDSAANTAAHARAARLVQDIQQYRAPAYAQLATELSRNYGARVLEVFWLINGVVAELPLGAIPALATRPDVLYVEPVQADEAPPQNTNPRDDVADGRARIVSDPYFGAVGGFIGLLDTGLRFTHNLLDNVDFRRDCVNGGADCNTGSNLNPNDDCWNHGTSSAAIITGSNDLGDAYRGVTAITLDSFKVYPTSFAPDGTCTGGLDRAAAVRGFQAAVAALDRVIVAEMQGNGSETSSISAAADNAFDAGAVIIAANGNNGPGAKTVNEPANAHKVLGVGAFDVVNLSQYSGQSRGPTADGRIKPDIQAPTNTETASTGCPFGRSCTQSDSALWVFSGTSGATPYAAGAAALLRDWMNGVNDDPIDPGQVYAAMILGGNKPYPFDNTKGAGRLELPTEGAMAWGKVSITNGQTINIPLFVHAGTRFDAALWWPESPGLPHNNIDLRIVDPRGAIRDSSVSIPSVFERARVAGRIVEGTWTIRIQGSSVQTGAQTVYWAMHVR